MSQSKHISFTDYASYHRGDFRILLPKHEVFSLMSKDPWSAWPKVDPAQELEAAEPDVAATHPAQPSATELLKAFIAEFEKPLTLRIDPTVEHLVLQGEELYRVKSRAKAARDTDLKRAEEALIRKLLNLGPLRAIANPSDNTLKWSRAIERLRKAHPHFDAVTNFVVGRVALSQNSDGPLYIPPIHLWGEPGVGKTHYANDLAKALGAPLRRHSMENAQSGSLLLGSERFWSNSSHGAIFDQVCMGTHANPVILLDELDKAPTDSRYSPTGPLHSLLEPLTARVARDASMDIEFDASLVTYIATSNDPANVPPSLRSRFRDFHILPPTGAQALQVAHVIAMEAWDRLGLRGFEPPVPAISRQLAHLTAREIHQVVQDSVAKAMQCGRDYMTFADLPADLLDELPNENVLH